MASRKVSESHGFLLLYVFLIVYHVTLLFYCEVV